jgi:hypothetical protein
MRARQKRWLTAQETAALLDSTSAEVCHLLSLGRLSGTKQKDPRRGGTAQWLVNPASISKEKKRRSAQRARMAQRHKRAAKRQG